MLRTLTLLTALAAAAPAQDLFDDTVLRTIELTFQQPDYWQQLKDNKAAGIYIEGDLTVDGETLTRVGVRLRGKSSFGAPNKKKPFKIKTDQYVVGQELWGYDSIRLNNGYFDPTFTRESVMANLIGDYMPIAKRAYGVLTINGEVWGPYIIEQQKDGEWMEENFAGDDGHRYASVKGGAFGWLGTNPGSYASLYDLQTEQLPDPWLDFIAGADAVNNHPAGPDTIQAMLPVANVDSLLWFIAADNAFGNNDSYAGNSNNWYVVNDSHHGRLEFVNHDLNLSFGTWDGLGPEFEPTLGFGNTSRPLVNRVMDDADTKREYFAHLRTLNKELLRWDVIGPRVEEYQNLIDAAFQADPKKLYTYAQFKGNVTQDVNVGFWVADAMQPYVEARHDYLLQHPLLDREEVEVASITLLPFQPTPIDSALVRVTTTDAVDVKKVELRWRTVGGFTRVAMKDDGSSGDSAAGDGIYGATIPPQAPGAVVEYYVVTTAQNGNAKTFFPTRGEWAPDQYVVTFGGAGVRITEYLYAGDDDEYVEVTNTGAQPVDLSGWSLDDESGMAGVFDLSPFGTLQPGESAIVAEADAAAFQSDWALSGVKIIGGNSVAKIGSNDAIYLFDGAGVVQDRLAFGADDYPGSVDADGTSASPCTQALGLDDPYLWTLAADGDAHGSWTSSSGDLGNPGTWVGVDCPGLGVEYCTSSVNSTGMAARLTVSGSLTIEDDDLTFLAQPLPSNQFGYLLMSDAQAHVPGFGGSQGVLCLGSPIHRFVTQAQSTGAGDFLQIAVDLGNLPDEVTVNPGESWNFQLWYRDQNPSATSNTTSALNLTFE